MADTVGLIEDAGGTAIAVALDLTDREAVTTLVAETESQLSRSTWWSMTPDGWWRRSVDNILTAAAAAAAAVPVAQLRDLGCARAWHPSGSADATGWAGMAVTELLVHGSDTAPALGLDLLLPADVCTRTVARVFPWIDRS